MAKEDKNEALHSEKDGRFVSKEKPEDFADMSASELRERQRIEVGSHHSDKNDLLVSNGASDTEKSKREKADDKTDSVPKESDHFKISLQFCANKKEIRYDKVPAIPKGNFSFSKDRLNTQNHIRHAQEMFGKDMKKYQKAAADFINRGDGNIFFSKYSGVFYKYNSQTQELAVFTTDNVIRTYHKRTNTDFERKINSEGMVKVK